MVNNFKVATALTRAHGHRYEARALEKPQCGLRGPSVWVWDGGRTGISCTRGSRLCSWQGGQLSALPACVDGLWGCPAQQEWRWWEGRATSLSTPDLTPPHQGSPVPKRPLPHLALKTWKVWGLRDMQKTKFYKAIILLLKNKKILKKKPQRTAKVGLVFSASLCQIPPVLMHQTKMLVLPPHFTDENRDTESLSILPQLMQLLRAGLRTGPLWLNLESRCCDDPEGVAETRRPMLSQARARTHTHTHTCACGLHL